MAGEVVEMVPARTPRPERREGWGMSTEAVCQVVYVKTAEDVVAAFDTARRNGWSVAAWGGGNSYGDAALNDGQLLVDFSRMDDILDWDPEGGVVTVQPGVTLGKLWRHTLSQGWWPPVVSGTMFTTVGGCASANVHGKNNYKHGTIGEHILAFTLATPDGQIREVTRHGDPELFHAAIGGMGWLGFFTSISLQLKRVHSGRLEVLAFTGPDLDAMFEGFERCREQGWDYVVGWIDGLAGGAGLGRGQIHAARYLKPGEDAEGQETLATKHQELPATLFGVVPKSWLHVFMRPFANRLGMRLINFGRYSFAKWFKQDHLERQSHGRFNFLLDYVPRWKWIYRPTGLIQYQFFLPEKRARDVFRRALELARAQKLEPWLVVMKRHRPDGFWLSHALDGYSFACDFPVTERNRGDLHRLTRLFDRMVVEAGGRFYFAKDSVVRPASIRASLGDVVLRRFLALKRRLDPDFRLGSNQFRRVIEPMMQELEGWPDFAGVLEEPLPEDLARRMGVLDDPSEEEPPPEAGDDAAAEESA